MMRFTFVASFSLLLLTKYILAADDEELDGIVSKSQRVLTLLSCSSPVHPALQEIVENLSQRTDTPPGLELATAENSRLCDLYRLSGGSHLVYFRNQAPLLVQGDLNPEVLAEFLSIHQDGPYVKRLNDETFEHDTQASTGATTGDWLVLFFRPGECDGLKLNLETAAAQLYRTMSVAEVDKSSSPGLVKRFQLDKCSNLLFFRQGSYYTFRGDEWPASQDIINFAEEAYQNVPPVGVPKETGGFDDIFDNIAAYQREFIIGIGVIIAMVFVVSVYVQSQGGKSDKRKKKKE